MFVWRVSKYPDLSGRGGQAASGRWHTRPQLIVYTADSARGACLEVLRHVGGEAALLPEDYRLLKIEIPEHLAIDFVETSDLDPLWLDPRIGRQLCRPVGDRWLQSHQIPLLRVPSAVQLGTYSILINPIIRATEEIRIVEVLPQPFPPECNL